MEIISRINWVDILAIILLIRTSYISLKAGFTSELFALIGVYLNIFFTLNYYAAIGRIISGTIPGLPLVLSNSFSFIGLAAIFAISFRVLRAILDKVVKIEWHPLIESIGGLLAGLARSFLAVSLVLLVLIMLPLPYMQWSIRDRSLTGIFFLKIGPTAYVKGFNMMPSWLKKGVSVNMEELMAVLVSEKSLKVHAGK